MISKTMLTTNQYEYVDKNYLKYTFSISSINRHIWVEIRQQTYSGRISNTYRVGESVLSSELLWGFGYPKVPEEVRLHILRFVRLSAFF